MIESGDSIAKFFFCQRISFASILGTLLYVTTLEEYIVYDLYVWILIIIIIFIKKNGKL
jgi:hypothetical protein